MTIEFPRGAPPSMGANSGLETSHSSAISVILKLLTVSPQKMFPLLDRQVPHVADKIFRYLDFEDYLTAREVCKEWKEYIEQSDILCACNGEEEGSGRQLLSAGLKCRGSKGGQAESYCKRGTHLVM